MRRWIIAGLLVALAAFLAYPPARNAWLIHRAQKSFQAGEERKAALQAMRLIQIDPGYVPAASLLADIAEKHLSRDALRWRLAAAKKNPSTENQIALARTSILFQEWEWADEALRAVPAADRKSIAYLQTVGGMALALNRNEEAAQFFNMALRLEPDNRQLILNSAIIQLALNQADEQSKAREKLEKLKRQPDFAAQAIRALIQDAMARGTSPVPLARELLALPHASFSDRLAALDALNKSKVPDFRELLATLQSQAADQPGETYALSNWMVRQGHVSEAKSWLDTLSPEQLGQVPVPMAYAECLLALKEWQTLVDRLSKEKWPDSEILRQAFLWRGKRELAPASQPETGLSDWQLALRGQTVRPGELYLAAQLLWSWDWQAEAEALWWILAEQTRVPESALRKLDRIYRNQKNTRKVWEVSRRAYQANPRDKIAQNNYAMLSLILNTDHKNAYTLAESLHRNQPSNSAFLSTYAFSLYRRGQSKEALQLFSTLNPKLLESPSYAFYYALFLKAEGRESESIRYAKLAEKADLLPEEKALMP